MKDQGNERADQFHAELGDTRPNLVGLVAKETRRPQLRRADSDLAHFGQDPLLDIWTPQPGTSQIPHEIGAPARCRMYDRLRLWDVQDPFVITLPRRGSGVAFSAANDENRVG